MNCLSFQSTHFHSRHVIHSDRSDSSCLPPLVSSEMGLLMSKMKARYSRIIGIRPTGWAGDVKHVCPHVLPVDVHSTDHSPQAGGSILCADDKAESGAVRSALLRTLQLLRA
jgi:hypothetical protein